METIVNAAFADILIPGRGDPIKNGAVVWQGKTILYAGAQSSLPGQYSQLQAETFPILMPGMWDSHIHFLGATAGRMEMIASTSQTLAGARSVQNLHDTVMAGFTSVREVGGYGCELSKAIDEGHVVGPKIYSSHSAISMTAGHADIHSMNLQHIHDLCAYGLPLAIVDGVSECIKAVRLQLRHGARVIKVCASGGVVSDLDDPKHQQFSLEELRAIVEEARRAGRAVAAHCHGKAGIMAALEAGCHTIEHGSYLDTESVDLMVKKGAMLVATRSVIESCLAMPEIFPPRAYQKMLSVANAHAEAYALAITKGVKIALGTDIFLASSSGPLTYGKNGQELMYAVKAGMTPLQAIEAATANGPMTLGEQAPLSGQLKEGYDADMIALSANPLEAIECIADPNTVVRVWKQGTLIKSS
ncbi:hypothetical protein PV08_00471 [Exophiala spinifera]|uniref:Amidohydrolase-related domain-containing protein n=1 Tax=Exophiala spinifera TaxID=91928 RepID=A0A0D1YX85_9EURO|nr:uncharacterized protein PV08_00471 [Exophiala spinifera]KIW19896.1 hypothetical protein PV08_00471 [Exophiala spinifera]